MLKPGSSPSFCITPLRAGAHHYHRILSGPFFIIVVLSVRKVSVSTYQHFIVANALNTGLKPLQIVSVKDGRDAEALRCLNSASPAVLERNLGRSFYTSKSAGSGAKIKDCSLPLFFEEEKERGGG